MSSVTVTNKEMACLKTISDGMHSEVAMAFLNTKATTSLVKKGLVETSVEINDEKGNVATRLTEKGIEFMSAQANEQFELDDNVPVPASSRRGAGRRETYPFDKMEVGHSFHVAVTDERPEPWKALASTVSTATQRYAVPDPDGGYKTNKDGSVKTDKDGNYVPLKIITRQFVVRRVDESDPKGPGARIFRVQ